MPIPWSCSSHYLALCRLILLFCLISPRRISLGKPTPSDLLSNLYPASCPAKFRWASLYSGLVWPLSGATSPVTSHRAYWGKRAITASISASVMRAFPLRTFPHRYRSIPVSFSNQTLVRSKKALEVGRTLPFWHVIEDQYTAKGYSTRDLEKHVIGLINDRYIRRGYAI